MPRTRIIRDTFYTDEKTRALPDDVRMFLITLWSAANDYGVGLFNIYRLKADFYEFRDDMTPERLQDMYRALLAIRDSRNDGLLYEFDAIGRTWYCIPSFRKHNSHRYPKSFDYPIPPADFLRKHDMTKDDFLPDTGMRRPRVASIPEEPDVPDVPTSHPDESEPATDDALWTRTMDMRRFIVAAYEDKRIPYIAHRRADDDMKLKALLECEPDDARVKERFGWFLRNPYWKPGYSLQSFIKHYDKHFDPDAKAAEPDAWDGRTKQTIVIKRRSGNGGAS